MQVFIECAKLISDISGCGPLILWGVHLSYILIFEFDDTASQTGHLNCAQQRDHGDDSCCRRRGVPAADRSPAGIAGFELFCTETGATLLAGIAVEPNAAQLEAVVDGQLNQTHAGSLAR